MRDLEEHLAVLGLKPGASAAEIKAAYREMLLLWHPDRFKAGHPFAQKAHEKTQAINAAYDRLKSYRATATHDTGSNVSPPPPRRDTQSYHSTSTRPRTTVDTPPTESPYKQSPSAPHWTIFVILLVLWLLGLVSSYTLGGFIHLLLVLAVVVLIINLIQGRRPL
jgi:uncharacterized protein DUF5670/DnaJ-like protein